MPFATLHVNSQQNSGTRVSPFTYAFGADAGLRGVGELNIPENTLANMTKEDELTRNLNVANGELIEWIGRQRPNEESPNDYDSSCMPVVTGETLTMGQQNEYNNEKNYTVLGGVGVSQEETNNKRKAHEEEITCNALINNTRKRREVRGFAGVNLNKQRERMKKRALGQSGGPLKVGDVVAFPANVSDTNKLSVNTVIAVVVERNESTGMNILGVRGGDILKERYRDGTVKKMKNGNIDTMGLRATYDKYQRGASNDNGNNQRRAPSVSERQAVIQENIVVANVSNLARIFCRCVKGKCQNCKCVKHGRKCHERCHGGRPSSLCLNCVVPS